MLVLLQVKDLTLAFVIISKLKSSTTHWCFTPCERLNCVYGSKNWSSRNASVNNLGYCRSVSTLRKELK